MLLLQVAVLRLRSCSAAS